ncbi:MAG: GatB/YqeY domain-containing protein [Patescibacteria group bacterium]
MGLKEKINKDLIQALKEKDSLTAGTLRFLLAGVHNREIEKRGKEENSVLDDAEVLEVLTREAKKRKEAAAIYEKGGRRELAEKELNELKTIRNYLPAELGENEIRQSVIETIEKIGAKDPKDFGKVMGEITKKLKGRAEASLISAIVKEQLENKNV